VQRGDYRAVAHLVPDEILRTFVAVGDADKLRERIGRAWSFADCLCIVPPAYALGPDKLFLYFAAIADAFYST
jgi:hypothetical protein